MEETTEQKMEKENGSNNIVSSGETDKEILAPSEGPRENLVATAVKFLQNPKVSTSPLYQKKLFLEKKGLTSEEIQLAVDRSGVKEINQSVQQVNGPPTGYQPGVLAPVNGPGLPVYPPQYAPIPPQSFWGRTRDLTFTAVLVAGVSYTVYQIFHKYLQPLLFGKTESERRIEQLTADMVQMQKTVMESLAQINNTLGAIKSSLDSQETKLLRPLDSQSQAEVKAEIASLKGLLLNRSQFPPMPATSPVLPAWQRVRPPSSDVSVTELQASVSDTNSNNRDSENDDPQITVNAQQADVEEEKLPEQQTENDEEESS